MRGTSSVAALTAFVLSTVILCGCNSSSYAPPPPPTTYTIGGTVSGLAGTGLVLQDNGGNNLAISANGPFTFTTALTSGSAYKATVFSQPTNVSQTCTVTSGGGTVGNGNVTNVAVSCVTDTFTVGGTVSGLVGTGLVLQDNSGDNLAIPSNGPFTFATPVVSGVAYDVTVLTEPASPAQICTVTNGSGTVTTGPITNVDVVCVSVTTSLIVPDLDNNRVLIYDTPFSTGQSASVVLGQPNFTSATIGTTATTIFEPSSIAADAAGNLFVSENGNCRVTQFKPPFSNGTSAALVLGQPDFTTGNCAAATSATSLGNSAMKQDEIFGVAVDRHGNVWVSDSGNNRVLEYKPPFTNGMAATLVIGQPDFTSGTPNQGSASPAAASMSDPGYAVFDPSGNLWVPDAENNRLLEFNPPFSTGMAAAVVLGQVDFTHGAVDQGGAVGANTLSLGGGVAFDSSGNLWIADADNNRVLEFEPPFVNNMSARLVLGQADFTGNSTNQGLAAPTSATLSFPHQVAFDSTGRLFVSDTGNNRTLVFAPPFSNGMDTTLVIGQASFTTGLSATTAATVNFPAGVTVAPPRY